MATTTPTTHIITNSPGPILDARKSGVNNINFIDHDYRVTWMRDMVSAITRLVPDSNTALISSNPTTPNTTALYRANIAAGATNVGGYYKRWAAAADQVFIGAGQDIVTYKLDGTAAVVLTADGKTYWLALVAVVVDADVELRAIVGAEADDASEVAITAAQINTALRAADITDHDPDVFQVLQRIKVQRVATDTITMTHTNPATDDTLASERARGYSIAAA
jgi:hypothetical protein